MTNLIARPLKLVHTIQKMINNIKKVFTSNQEAGLLIIDENG